MLLQWVSYEFRRLPTANGKGRARKLSVGLVLRWWRGSLSWKARYEFELRVGLLLWEWTMSGFIPHRLSAAERGRIIDEQQRREEDAASHRRRA